MATIRLSTKEVQVDDTIYVFDVVQVADRFEACVAVLDAGQCLLDHPPVAKRPSTAERQEEGTAAQAASHTPS